MCKKKKGKKNEVSDSCFTTNSTQLNPLTEPIVAH